MSGIRWTGACALWLVATASSLSGQGGVDDKNGVFQMEGNATSDTQVCFKPSAGTGSGITNPDVVPVTAGTCPAGFTLVTFGTLNDWASLGTVVATTGIVTDLTNSNSDDIFTGGASKDISDVSSWLWKGGKPQAKDDIAHAYATAYRRPSDNHTIIVVGLDRYDNSGNATAGFWFLRDSRVRENNAGGGGFDGAFNGTHSDGDLLIVSDFSTGGATSTITVYKWVGNGTTGSLVFQQGVTSGNATCNPTAGSQSLCGISNPRTVSTGGWTFLDKSGSSDFLHGEFLEVAIDLNTVFPQGTPCFSTFMAETRSSTSDSSTLSDFTPPHSFPLCSVSVTKTCTGSTIINGNQVQYNFSGAIKNTSSSATVYYATLTDTPPANATNLSVSVPDTSTGILANASVTYTGSFRTSALLGANDKNSVRVTASSSSTGTPQDVGPATADWGNPTTGNCPPAVQPGLTLEKKCSSCLTGTSSGLVIGVAEAVKVCNSGNVEISNITVKDCRGALTGGVCSTTQTTFGSVALLPPGQCTTLTGSYTPTSATGTSCQSGNCSFSDIVTASGTAALGGGTVNALPAQATCPLCPINTICTTPTFP